MFLKFIHLDMCMLICDSVEDNSIVSAAHYTIQIVLIEYNFEISKKLEKNCVLVFPFIVLTSISFYFFILLSNVVFLIWSM